LVAFFLIFQVLNLIFVYIIYALITKSLIISKTEYQTSKYINIIDDSSLHKELNNHNNHDESSSRLIYYDGDNSKCELPTLRIENLHQDVETEKKCFTDQNWGFFSDENSLNQFKWFLYANIKQNYDQIECEYAYVNRLGNDFSINLSKFSPLIENQTIIDHYDVIEVNCKGINKTNRTLTTRFEYLFPLILDNKKQQRQQQQQAKTDTKKQPTNDKFCHPLNVILLSYDSVSRASWLNRAKKSYDFAVKTMKFDILEGYNIVGDGTPAALIPIFTGKTEEELPSVLKSDPKGRFVDESYPLIWHDLHRNGIFKLKF
jgi:hypothetical protein